MKIWRTMRQKTSTKYFLSTHLFNQGNGIKLRINKKVLIRQANFLRYLIGFQIDHNDSYWLHDSGIA